MEHSPVEGATFRAHLTLAIEADTRRMVRTPQRELALLARVDPGHLRRCLRELVDAGAVTILEPPSGQKAALLRLETKVVERASCAVVERASRALQAADESARDARSNGNAPIPRELLDKDQELPPKSRRGRSVSERVHREHEDASDAVLRRVWARKDPKPAQPWVALVKIGERLFAAGWSAEMIEEAMVDADTISTRWCESTLARQRRQAEKVMIVSPFGEPRSGPSNVADVEQSRPVVGPWVCAAGNADCVNGWINDVDVPVGTPMQRCECSRKGN